MSRPVPSPSMNGMIGWSGTASLPFLIEIFAPPAGGATLGLVGVDIVACLSERFLGVAMLTQGFYTIRPHGPNPRHHSRAGRLRDACRMGAPRRLLDALAGAPRQLARGRAAGAARVRRGRGRDRALRAGER